MVDGAGGVIGFQVGPDMDSIRMNDIEFYITAVGRAIDVLGVAVIVAGMLFAVVRFFFSGQAGRDRYRIFREHLSRGILLGLEFLIAADIIRTVAVTPTVNGVFVLGIIVLIRTFLSLSLQVEIDGRWPWQRVADKDAQI